MLKVIVICLHVLATITFTKADSPRVTPEVARRAVIVKDPEAVTAIVAAGRTGASLVEPYLRDENVSVRQGALEILSRIPDAAPEALKSALLGTDGQMRATAIIFSRPYLANARLREAWANCAAEGLACCSIAQHVYDALHHVDEDTRTAIKRELIPRLVPRLNSMDANRARVMILFVGEFAAADDASTKQALAGLRLQLEREMPEQWSRNSFPVEIERRSTDFKIALDFALANLGDAGAIQRFASMFQDRSNRDRLAYLKLLKSFRPSPRLLTEMRLLLDDRSDVQNIAPSHMDHARYKHACDFAIEALSAWYREFPVRMTQWGVYSQDEHTIARTWVDSRLVSNE